MFVNLKSSIKKEKIEMMVAAYNRYAIKHGYTTTTIEVDYENRKVIGTFIPKDENTYSGFKGFFKNAMIAGCNGSLEADYGRIVKALSQYSTTTQN